MTNYKILPLILNQDEYQAALDMVIAMKREIHMTRSQSKANKIKRAAVNIIFDSVTLAKEVN